ncbi:MAG: acyl carrier protein [Deltaproteobacteria bacterium CG_4_8_14_3_um_filter_51_11]|nr:acyl carrier protein [bacterium]OIP39823.1 MAG: acyl carrier protein [Desulfobacteraceae bacterium CG2_30_51_40]PIP47285.1 MAG: acyl carrier protein [Deltaproteobacteria bacterium CG23_combo_of_CG06-09_8_20_14_all_51_20]PIX19478.1 MAG: acyl carrier protein [Deltaproteobacteria bacterium CG_4_8_14_3_um_filter_51_11]PIY22823.1 MAG: acyl carrier protein [Deltaproteobacteria bacterium CG_4_10_14_3_um_filter_51_14]PJB35229.1 MAG: acyl carrier protein [Deltaproteobacteria bacterium CG_4_9_14_3_um
MAYTEKEISEKVIAVLADKGKVEKDQINMDSSLVDDLGMDSLDAVEMVFEFEEQYGIQIPDEAIQGFKFVRDIVSYLMKVIPEKQ